MHTSVLKLPSGLLSNTLLYEGYKYVDPVSAGTILSRTIESSDTQSLVSLLRFFRKYRVQPRCDKNVLELCLATGKFDMLIVLLYDKKTILDGDIHSVLSLASKRSFGQDTHALTSLLVNKLSHPVVPCMREASAPASVRPDNCQTQHTANAVNLLNVGGSGNDDGGVLKCSHVPQRQDGLVMMLRRMEQEGLPPPDYFFEVMCQRHQGFDIDSVYTYMKAEGLCTVQVDMYNQLQVRTSFALALSKYGMRCTGMSVASKEIGHGSYGIVYGPGFPCQGRWAVSMGVSKLLSSRDAIKEFRPELNARLRRADPEFQYHAAIYESCFVSGRAAPYTRNARGSPMDTVINLQHGGVPLSDYTCARRPLMLDQSQTKLQSIWGFCMHICRAVTAMELVGVYHMDLKPANFVCSGLYGWTRPRLIDFGLAVICSRSYVDFRLSDLYIEPYTWPIQLSFLGKREISLRQRQLLRPNFRAVCRPSYNGNDSVRLWRQYHSLRRFLRQRSQSNVTPLPPDLFTLLRNVLRRCNLLQLAKIFEASFVIEMDRNIHAHFFSLATGQTDAEIDSENIDYVDILRRAANTALAG